MLSSARRANDWCGVGKEGGSRSLVVGRRTRDSRRWEKLVKSAVEWGSLWCVSRVSRAVCRVALVSCGSACVSRVSSSIDDDVFLVPIMSGARSSPRSPATFSPSSSPSLSPFYPISTRAADRRSRASGLPTDPRSLSPCFDFTKSRDRTSPAGRSLSNPCAGFVGKSVYKRGNFNAWNSRPLPRVTARDSLENVELRFSDEWWSGCRDKKCRLFGDTRVSSVSKRARFSIVCNVRVPRRFVQCTLIEDE